MPSEPTSAMTSLAKIEVRVTMGDGSEIPPIVLTAEEFDELSFSEDLQYDRIEPPMEKRLEPADVVPTGKYGITISGVHKQKRAVYEGRKMLNAKV